MSEESLEVLEGSIATHTIYVYYTFRKSLLGNEEFAFNLAHPVSNEGLEGTVTVINREKLAKAAGEIVQHVGISNSILDSSFSEYSPRNYEAIVKVVYTV